MISARSRLSLQDQWIALYFIAHTDSPAHGALPYVDPPSVLEVCAELWPKYFSWVLLNFLMNLSLKLFNFKVLKGQHTEIQSAEGVT